MTSWAGGQQKTKCQQGGERQQGPAGLEVCFEAGGEVLLPDHAPPCPENLTFHGKVLWGTSKPSLSALCVPFILSHLGVLTGALEFKIGVLMYSNCYVIKFEKQEWVSSPSNPKFTDPGQEQTFYIGRGWMHTSVWCPAWDKWKTFLGSSQHLRASVYQNFLRKKSPLF